MRILMLSDGECKGGASTAAARLAQGLTRQGHEVLRVLRFPDPPSAPPPGQPHPWRTEVIETPAELVRGWLEPPSETALAFVQGELARVLRDFRPQGISVHNLHGATRHGWSAALAGQCAQAAPTVWTLHDLWSATGRCAYTGGCRLHRSGGCDASCPSWRVYPACPPEAIAARLAEKRAVLADSPDLTAVAPSAWLADETRRGLWAGCRVEVLANGLDLDVFHPVDRAVARKRLGLPEQGRVLLAVSLLLDDPRKGTDILLNALPLLEPGATLLLMGGGELAVPEGHVAVRRLGLLTDDAAKVLAYSAADALVHPAREDNLPNTVAEALACGTPVAGFSVGGVAEMLAQGAGVAAPELSPKALAQAVTLVLAQDAHTARARCRELAQQRYDLPRQAGKLVRIFEELTEARAGKARQD
jgi:glycosyltransferase involved in cell wall biosynthesis